MSHTHSDISQCFLNNYEPSWLSFNTVTSWKKLTHFLVYIGSEVILDVAALYLLISRLYTALSHSQGKCYYIFNSI